MQETTTSRFGIKEIQTIALEALKNFASFCELNDIRYFICCGTLIGAVRHKGFIPWDDDIDVFMPRKDYLRFLALTKGTLEPHYRVLSPYITPNYIYTYAKLCDCRTTLIEFPETIKFKIGIYIDIYPVDGLPDSVVESDKLIQQINRLKRRHWLFNVKYQIFMQKTDIFRKTYGHLIYIFGKIIGKDFFFKKIDNKAMEYDFEKCNFVARTVAGRGIKERIDHCCFAKYEKVEFEGNYFNAPSCGHQYLTNIYGDYMKLPPEKDRVKRHNNEAYWNPGKSVN